MSNSEDMQEFLVLNSDASRYFGRKPFVKSRIDKVRKIFFNYYSFFLNQNGYPISSMGDKIQWLSVHRFDVFFPPLSFKLR